MPEMGTSGLMSGDGKRDGAVAPVLAPILDSTGIGRRTSAWTPTWQPKRSRHGSSATIDREGVRHSSYDALHQHLWYRRNPHPEHGRG
jgi:hypothetical protein